MSGIRVLTASRLLSCWDIFPNIDRIRHVKCPVFVIHGMVRYVMLYYVMLCYVIEFVVCGLGGGMSCHGMGCDVVLCIFLAYKIVCIYVYV